MKRSIKALPILLLIFTISNCSRETIGYQHKDQNQLTQEPVEFSTVPLKESLEFLKAAQSDIAYKNNNSLGLEIDLQSLHQVEITNTDAKLNVADATTKFDQVESQVLQIMIDGTLQTVLFNVIPESNSENNEASRPVSENEFTGNIVITTLSGTVLNNFEYASGVLAGEIDLNSYNDDPEEPCWGIGCGIDLEEVVVTASSVNPYYYTYSYNANTSNIFNVYQWNRSVNNYSTMGIAYASYHRQRAIEEFEEKIIDDELQDCLKAIMSGLKAVNQGAGTIIAQFAGNTPGFNWEVKTGSLSGQTALTEPPANYNPTTGTITTIFDSQGWNNATDLSWARTILHESIHAYLVSYYKINRPGWIATYPEMVEDWGTFQNWNDVHHEEIARSLVTSIAIALESYGESRGYNLDQQFYEDIAWGGLQDTSTFENLPSSDKERILDTISTELTGNDTDGNSKSQKGENAGCQ